MNKDSIVIFVCEHGAAKSIIAATYFNQLAKQKRLGFRAVVRGTNPDHELSESTTRGLAQDGLIPTESTPHQLLLEEMQSAERIVSFCELPIEYQHSPTIEQWNDVPPVSENYEKARDAIVEHLYNLIDTIRSSS